MQKVSSAGKGFAMARFKICYRKTIYSDFRYILRDKAEDKITKQNKHGTTQLAKYWTLQDIDVYDRNNYVAIVKRFNKLCKTKNLHVDFGH